MFFSVGARREQVEHFFHRLVEIVGDVFQLDAAGLDLREVQDVVDDDQQALGRAADRAGEVGLLPVELGVEQQVAEADHAVHRRADLVAHRREELALGAIGGFGLVARFGQLLAVRVDAHERVVERVRDSPSSSSGATRCRAPVSPERRLSTAAPMRSTGRNT